KPDSLAAPQVTARVCGLFAQPTSVWRQRAISKRTLNGRHLARSIALRVNSRIPSYSSRKSNSSKRGTTCSAANTRWTHLAKAVWRARIGIAMAMHPAEQSKSSGGDRVKPQTHKKPAHPSGHAGRL